MIIEKKYYLEPDCSVTRLCAESFLCVSNLGSIIATTEEENDGNEWTPIN